MKWNNQPNEQDDTDEYTPVRRTIINGRTGRIETEYEVPRYVVDDVNPDPLPRAEIQPEQDRRGWRR